MSSCPETASSTAGNRGQDHSPHSSAHIAHGNAGRRPESITNDAALERSLNERSSSRRKGRYARSATPSTAKRRRMRTPDMLGITLQQESGLMSIPELNVPGTSTPPPADWTPAVVDLSLNALPLGLQVRSHSLWRRMITHKSSLSNSIAIQQVSMREASLLSYRPLEFKGDALLKQAVAEVLWRWFPDRTAFEYNVRRLSTCSVLS